METIYRVDGKEFTDLKEAKKYEEKRLQEKVEYDRLIKEKQKRIDEINEKTKELDDLINKFYGDYEYIFFFK